MRRGRMRTAAAKRKAHAVEFQLTAARYAIRDGHSGIAADLLKMAIEICQERDQHCRKAIRRRRRTFWKFAKSMYREGNAADDGSITFQAVKSAVERGCSKREELK